MKNDRNTPLATARARFPALPEFCNKWQELLLISWDVHEGDITAMWINVSSPHIKYLPVFDTARSVDRRDQLQM